MSQQDIAALSGKAAALAGPFPLGPSPFDPPLVSRLNDALPPGSAARGRGR